MAEGNATKDQSRCGLEAFTLDALEVDRVRYDRTKNPLIVWQALNSWFTLNHYRAQAEKAPLPVPEWIVGYLNLVARRIADLSKGLDYRETPEPYGTLPRTQESVQRAKNRVQTLTPNKARDQVPAALGLVRNGWNAFERLSALRGQEIDELSMEGYRWMQNSGVKRTVEQASEMIVDDYEVRGLRKGVKPEVTDSRSVKRRIAKLKHGKGTKPRG